VNITTHTGLVGFFLALSALQVSGTVAATNPTEVMPDPPQSIESRLSRLTSTIRQRETLLSPDANSSTAILMANAAWGNGGGGGFANRLGPGGFVNGGGGGFVNGGGWRNGGGFLNY